VSAVISDDGRYRYTLEREWMTGEGTCLFVMLNPSTADATEDDPTIRRCIGFAQRWGYQRLTVGNLFGMRATDPAEMLETTPRDATGSENDDWLRCLSAQADRVIAAWGAHPLSVFRAPAVQALLLERHPAIHCLGTTQNGSPRHPLYVKGDFEPREYARGPLGAPGVAA
jgi:hypothetical protein